MNYRLDYKLKIAIAFIPFIGLSACTTTKKAEIVEVKVPQVAETCVHIDTLKKVVIPAEVKKGFSIVSIEGRTEQYYDPDTKSWKTVTTPPIQRKEPWTKIIKPAQTIYVDQDNREITDICELKNKPSPTATAEPAAEATETLTKANKAESKPVSEDTLPPVQ